MYTADNMDYVSSRLRGTCVLHKEHGLFYVDHVIREKEKVVLVGCVVSDGMLGNYIRLPIEQFNLETPKLGNCNFDGRAFFITRVPLRKDWKQGIRGSNLSRIEKLNEIRPYGFEGYKLLVNTVVGKFPSFTECVDRVEDIYTEAAFTHDFMVDSNMVVYYKNRFKVGSVTDYNKIRIYDDYQWLEESLAEVTK